MRFQLSVRVLLYSAVAVMAAALTLLGLTLYFRGLTVPNAVLNSRVAQNFALRYGLRDGGKHASPNSGISEAASAGALGVQLGGPVYRQGRLSEAPLLGESLEPLQRHHISAAVRLMLVTALLFSLFLCAVCTLVVH